MASAYPASDFSWTNRVDNVDDVLAADVNTLAGEINAISDDLIGTGTASGLKQAAASFSANWRAEHSAAGKHTGISDGSAGAPSISFASDPDTGIYRYSANSLSLVTNGSDALMIQTSAIIAYRPFQLHTSAYLIYDFDSNEFLKFVATASAVNELTVTNAATAGNPKLSATGGDTNINLQLAAKGTGSIYSTNRLHVFFNSVGTVQPHIRLDDDGYYAVLMFAAVNVDRASIAYDRANAAVIIGGTNLSTPTITMSFYNTGELGFQSAKAIVDANKNELIKFPATVASAVNELTISNAATGGAVALSATGGDTNINLSISPKAAGTVIIDGLNAGKMGSVRNTAFGVDALSVSAAYTGNGDNTAIGYNALKLNQTTGTYNVALGAYALAANTTGTMNTAVGYVALYSNQTGSGNIAIGHNAGRYATGSNELYIDNQNRTNTAGDKAGAILYGVFDATPTSQTLQVNAKLILRDGTAAAPSLVFGSDLTTGIYRYGSEIFGITTAGVSRFGIDSAYVYLACQISFTNEATAQINDRTHNQQLIFLRTASAVNEFSMRNAATGNAPQLLATGDDTDIDLYLIPKGAGNIKFGTYVAGAATDSTGYITIKDAGGTARKVMIQA